MSRRKPRAMNKREGEVLLTILGMHREFGVEARFTRQAVEHVLGSECAGSLGGLAMLGYVTQRTSPDGLVYAITASGAGAAKLVLEGRRPIRVNGS